MASGSKAITRRPVAASASTIPGRSQFHACRRPGSPGPSIVSLPRLLDDEPIQILGYPITMILAERSSRPCNAAQRTLGGVTSSISTHRSRRPEITKRPNCEQRSSESLNTDKPPSVRSLKPSPGIRNSHKIDGPRGGVTNGSKAQLRSLSPPYFDQSSTRSTSRSGDPCRQSTTAFRARFTRLRPLRSWAAPTREPHPPGTSLRRVACGAP